MEIQNLMWELFRSTGSVDIYLLYRSYVAGGERSLQAEESEVLYPILRGVE